MSKLKSIEAIPGSFRDPANRVFRVKGSKTSGDRILRGLNNVASENFENLQSCEFYKKFQEHGRIVKTSIADESDSDVKSIKKIGWHQVLEHQVVPFISYPYEWTFGMLKSAALLHLNLLEAALEEGWILKDSTPYNVQFIGSRATFIDIPSFEPWVEGEPWVGYRQFCTCFLTPLMMRAYLGLDHLPLMRSYIDGIPPAEAAKYFRGRSRYRKGVLSHIIFPARVENKILSRERDDAPASVRKGTSHSKSMVIGLVQSMRRIVRGLEIDLDHTDWSNYDQTHTYVEEEHHSKIDFVKESAKAKQPSMVWDIGCNTGTFSRAASEFADTVVSVDGDHNAIEKLYQVEKKSKGEDLLPLVMNLSNISPDQGWAGKERAAFDHRRKPDLVLVLALVHHIRLSANIPLDLFLKWLRSLEADIVIEFVCRHDEMVVKLLTNKDEQYADYNLDEFLRSVEEDFKIKSQRPLKGGKRQIFHLVPK